MDVLLHRVAMMSLSRCSRRTIQQASPLVLGTYRDCALGACDIIFPGPTSNWMVNISELILPLYPPVIAR